MYIISKTLCYTTTTPPKQKKTSSSFELCFISLSFRSPFISKKNIFFISQPVVLFKTRSTQPVAPLPAMLHDFLGKKVRINSKIHGLNVRTGRGVPWFHPMGSPYVEAKWTRRLYICIDNPTLKGILTYQHITKLRHFGVDLLEKPVGWDRPLVSRVTRY